MLENIFKRKWNPTCRMHESLEGKVEIVSDEQSSRNEQRLWRVELTQPDGQVVYGKGESKQIATSRTEMQNLDWCQNHNCFSPNGECYIRRIRKEGQLGPN